MNLSLLLEILSVQFCGYKLLYSLFCEIQIASAVNQGELVPEDIVFGLLSKRLEEGQCKGESGFILDGLPRTRVQAVSW